MPQTISAKPKQINAKCYRGNPIRHPYRLPNGGLATYTPSVRLRKQDGTLLAAANLQGKIGSNDYISLSINASNADEFIVNISQELLETTLSEGKYIYEVRLNNYVSVITTCTIDWSGDDVIDSAALNLQVNVGETVVNLTVQGLGGGGGTVSPEDVAAAVQTAMSAGTKRYTLMGATSGSDLVPAHAFGSYLFEYKVWVGGKPDELVKVIPKPNDPNNTAQVTFPAEDPKYAGGLVAEIVLKKIAL